MNQEIYFWWQVASSCVLGLVTIVTFARKPGEEATNALNQLTLRVTSLEEQIKHIPNSEDLNRVAGDLREVKTRLEGLVESQRIQTGSMQRIENFLMHNK